MARLVTTAPEIKREWCYLRVIRHMGRHRAYKALQRRFPGVELAVEKSFLNWEVEDEEFEKYRAEVFQKVEDQAKESGFAVHSRRVDGLNRKMEVLEFSIEECDDPGAQVVLIREYRQLAAEMSRQMLPYEESKVRGRSHAEKWQEKEEKKSRWQSQAGQDSSTIPAN